MIEKQVSAHRTDFQEKIPTPLILLDKIHNKNSRVFLLNNKQPHKIQWSRFSK